ncbi:hypothetical protein H072_4464 [Dactylellina haptotyla CBS 200.50]|uniref:Uncharacterized protein n=1 Tax=Dactylellina haptotyla (strain CBS 200.50) TaxID=1284197 RepID=S8AFE5_DACHA|nr:hypothetical protein H072_4464 [Dactylellina haptotyla CBS 200.50]
MSALEIPIDLSSIPQATKDINLRITSIAKIYKDILSKLDDCQIEEIEEAHREPDVFATEISTIGGGVIQIFQIVNENPDLEKKRQAKVHGGDFEMALKRYQGILGQYIKKTNERLGINYKVINPEATETDIEEVRNSDEAPLFFSAPESQPRPDGWHAARKEYMARYTETKKVEERSAELKGWLGAVSEVRSYAEPVDDKLANVQPIDTKIAEVKAIDPRPAEGDKSEELEITKENSETARDAGKVKRRSFKWLNSMKSKLGLGKS